MDIAINFYGRFGEHFVYFHNEDDTYKVSCKEIGMKDKLLSKQEFDELFHKYYYKGVPGFDKSDIETIKQRANNMGRELSREFWTFKHNNGSYEKIVSAIRIYEWLSDSDELGLDKEQFLDWFLNGYSKQTKEYIDFMLTLKRKLVDERRGDDNAKLRI